MKILKDILANCKIIQLKGSASIPVRNISIDSRKVNASDLFIAIKGTQVDGHVYIDQAIQNGAKTIICQRLPENIHEDITYVQVENTEKVSGIILSNFYNNPSSKLKLIGVTGTNGKTTTATLLYKLFRSLGYKTGLLSTIKNYVNDNEYDATLTTPDPVQLFYLLDKMVEESCEYCFMEVSSHALAQDRVNGLAYTGGIYTNLTHDHLDYHKNFNNYLKAKKKFFDNLSEHSFALVNKDDKNSQIMIQNTSADIKTYSVKSSGDFCCTIIETHFDGTLIKIEGKEIWTPLVGDFNVYNLLAVYASALLLGQDSDKVLTILSEFREVRGRFECVRSSNKVTAIIDYAHTPDALLNVLRTIKQLKKGNEQLITVVGAGGNRDKTKRPVMAKVSVDFSDKVILTSDNPRNEEPEDIINDMMKGVDPGNSNKVVAISNRYEAIKTAVLLARENDIILIAGKGHEDYQEIKGVRNHFDDKEVVTELFT